MPNRTQIRRLNRGFYRITTASNFILLPNSTPVVDMCSVVTGLEDALGDNEEDANALINTYINANTSMRSDCIWYFKPGTYYHHVDIYQLGLSNVALVGAPGTVFQKLSGDSATTREYSFFTTGSENVYVDSIEWRGVTTSLTEYGFGGSGLNADSGLYFGSCDTTRVTNCRFYNFGDSVIRMATNPASTEGVSSFNGHVEGCYLYNCTQITTTSNAPIIDGVSKGGCQNYHLINNHADNLKGSFKAACRYATTGVIMRDNIINCASGASSSVGIELASYTNAQIINNTITGASAWGMNCYPNVSTGMNMFEYGNYTIDGNTFQNNYRGIRVNNNAYPGDGLQATPTNINITRNTIDGTTYNADSTAAGVLFSGGNWGSGQVKDNTLSNIANSSYIAVQTNITSSGNITV